MTIQRIFLFVATAAVTLECHAASLPGNKAPRFEVKLSPDQKILQALNRLTFGPRPGDVERVRRMGVEKWIETQLHPEDIAENPVVETRLKPLETLRMTTADAMKEYQRLPAGFNRQGINLNELLPGAQFRKVFNGTAEERRASLMALDPEKRTRVLAVLPPNVVEDLPDLKKEQQEARQKQQEERQMEIRRMRPPLTDLLDAHQREIALHGTTEQRAALYASLDPEKLTKVAAALPPDALAARPDLRRAGEMMRSPQLVPIDDLREGKLYRALYSNRQLEEVLTDFWFNHFNVFEGKGQDRALLASYERDAIRPHVLGKFKDLLLATARHPAMLYYLDNWESMAADVFQVGPFAPGPGGRPFFFGRQAHGLNENYGRELLELHTLGVNGGYTQHDVIEVARCFTGWTIRSPNEKPEFVFASFMHDAGEKVVLGHRIPAGGGEQDGLQVIDILAHHPSTARFISTELARRFVADAPPPTLVDRMARTFVKTDGDLRAVLQTMFTSREFFSEGAWHAKIKSPLEMVASAVRGLNADAADAYVLAQKTGEMGEPLYGAEPPSGYKDTAEAWLSTANVIARISFAEKLVKNQVAGVKVDTAQFDGKDTAGIARALLGRDASEDTITEIGKAAQAKQAPGTWIAGLILGSPEFERR